ncbi:GNAT family N-acetyltransferase [Algicella marina]|uniref:GNAT family N-acetyltransferase n=1 Tax=Algicella marina TaxID=2683284 RepID=A0A6P1SXP7_9RHOB|nr:GNAT family N-acetyltransferase [Algicella marina]QHQ33769.1 GNAT family N-acetyltransferase [Algicella marina]
MISFRILEPADYPMIREWLARAHMKPWWDEELKTVAQVASAYSRNPASTWRYIAQENGCDIGYFQYWREDGLCGVDQFLAEGDRLGQGLGTATLSAFIAYLENLGITDPLTADPHVSNTRAIRCYEKCGFIHDPDRSTETRYFMERPRPAS